MNRLSLRRRSARVAGVPLVALLLAALPPTGGRVALASGGCSAQATPGGDWPMYGRDLKNTRFQPGEAGLGPLKAATLAPRWVFDTGHPSEVLSYVDINSTPVVARGCVYVGDAGGNIVALDASSGALVWRRHIEVLPPGSGVRGGTVVGTIAITGNQAIVVVNQEDRPYVVSLDADTGALRWASPAIDSQIGSYSHASPAVYRDVIFVGFSAAEGIASAQGGYALVDVADGHILAKSYTIPEADQAQGYGGGGLWSTPAVDAATGYAFVGAGNPFSKLVEHERTNAILKIDLDRNRPTFGTIVASYKGNIDQFLEALQALSQPTCQLAPENPPLPAFPPFLPPLEQARDSFTCFQLDLDFGASANLFTGPDGSLLIGELQKSGVYHVVRADTMAVKRRVVLGVSCLACNAASTAYDSGRGKVVANFSPGSFMASFSPITGAVDWRAVVGDVVHYQPVAVASGVAYTVDSLGFLDAFNVTTGLPLLKRSLVLDGALDAVGAFASSGVSIANHTVYAAAGSRVIAYRPLGVL